MGDKKDVSSWRLRQVFTNRVDAERMREAALVYFRKYNLDMGTRAAVVFAWPDVELFGRLSTVHWSKFGLNHASRPMIINTGIERGRDKITKRDIKIIALVAEGYTNDTIGYKLGISTRVISARLTRLNEKFKTNSRVSIVVKAITYGLIEMDEGGKVVPSEEWR